MADNMKSPSVLSADLQAAYNRLLTDYTIAVADIGALERKLGNSYSGIGVLCTLAFVAGLFVAWFI